GGNDTLWKLHELDIMDKHKLIIPVGASHTGFDLKFWIADPHTGQAHGLPPVHFNSEIIYPLTNGTELLRVGQGVNVEDHINFTFEVAFGDGQVMKGDAVLPTLQQLIDFVERIIEIIAKYA